MREIIRPSRRSAISCGELDKIRIVDLYQLLGISRRQHAFKLPVLR